MGGAEAGRRQVLPSARVKDDDCDNHSHCCKPGGDSENDSPQVTEPCQPRLPPLASSGLLPSLVSCLSICHLSLLFDSSGLCPARLQSLWLSCLRGSSSPKKLVPSFIHIHTHQPRQGGSAPHPTLRESWHNFIYEEFHVIELLEAREREDGEVESHLGELRQLLPHRGWVARHGGLRAV